MKTPEPERTITYADRAAFYDLEYTETNDHEFLAELVKEHRTVLEIPSGAGRNTLILARGHPHFAAADREPRMVERLQARAAGDPDLSGLRTFVADMRNLGEGEEFDLILIQREAFQMICGRDDVLSALRSLRGRLARGGTLFIDLATFLGGDARRSSDDLEEQPGYYDPAQLDGKEVLEWTRRGHSGEQLTRWRTQHHVGDLVRIAFRYHVQQPDGSTERWGTELRLARYTHDEFTRLLTESQLVARSVYRDYLRRPYEAGASRMIFLIGQGDLES